MTAQQYYDTYHGQSLLYNQKDPTLRGQCVQAVCFYVVANKHPVIWANAYQWWTERVAQYEYIGNSAGSQPHPGDIIIWRTDLPGSAGDGHIAVCLQANPSTFISVDQNWGGKTVHQVTHNYNYVVGWLRFKGTSPTPSPAPKPAPKGGDEMIANDTQAHQAYQLLRPNGDGSKAEIAATVGHRTWAAFANDAQKEVAVRNQALKSQAQHVSAMQTVINSQNQTITDLTLKLKDSETTTADKQKALGDALTELGQQNADLTTLHDQVTDNQTIPQPAVAPAPGNPNFLAKLIINVFHLKPKQ